MFSYNQSRNRYPVLLSVTLQYQLINMGIFCLIGMEIIVSIIPFITMLVVYYFLIFSHQQKNKKKPESRLKNIKPGDLVETSTGIMGEVVRVEQPYLVLKSYNSLIKVKSEFVEKKLSS